MPEIGGPSVEVAHHLSEAKHGEHTLAHEILEIIEAVVLAVVAIATAWSGYQAALWDGHQDELYGESSHLRIRAEGLTNTANQERLYNASTVVEWLKAAGTGNKKLADMFERRFLPDIIPAFRAWKATDPLNNPNAPAGPQLMPQYHNAKLEQAQKLSEEAEEMFEQGTRARQRSDQYVRLTVVLATVLLLMAVSQRFKTHGVRVALATVAVLLLAFPVIRIFLLPRA